MRLGMSNTAVCTYVPVYRSLNQSTTLNGSVDANTYDALTTRDLQKINAYTDFAICVRAFLRPRNDIPADQALLEFLQSAKDAKLKLCISGLQITDDSDGND